jgi:hypothetical protein
MNCSAAKFGAFSEQAIAGAEGVEPEASYPIKLNIF